MGQSSDDEFGAPPPAKRLRGAIAAKASGSSGRARVARGRASGKGAAAAPSAASAMGDGGGDEDSTLESCYLCQKSGVYGGEWFGKKFCDSCFPVLRGHFRTIAAEFPKDVISAEKAQMFGFPDKWREQCMRLLAPDLNSKARAAATEGLRQTCTFRCVLCILFLDGGRCWRRLLDPASPDASKLSSSRGGGSNCQSFIHQQVC